MQYWEDEGDVAAFSVEDIEISSNRHYYLFVSSGAAFRD
jgi:hypothetical protein